MKKKGKIVLVSVALIAGLTTVWFLTRPPKKLYEIEQVAKTTVAQTVSVTAELVPEQYADLSFSGVATVKKVLVSRGDTVKAGQWIAILDSSVLNEQLKDANISLSIALENEKFARRTWSKLKKEERAAKKLATDQARQKVTTVQTQIALATLTAPIGGVVTKLDVREGETALSGKVVARISKGTGLVLEARVPEADITKLKNGMEATVTFDALTKDDVFRSNVYEIEPAATVVQDVVSYVTRFRLADADDRLREGMSATIDAVTAKAENVLAVPFRAVIREGAKNYVELSQDGLTALKREVVLGLEGDEGMIEVKKGLSSNDIIVTAKVK